MGSYYRRLISDAFRCHNRKMEQSVSRNYLGSRSDPRRSGICERSILHNNQIRCDDFIAKRFYHGALKPNGLGYRGRYEIGRNLMTLGFVGCVVAIPVYYLDPKTAPYTERGHFAAVPTSVENSMGEFICELFESNEWGGKMLGPDHPLRIRVEKIGQGIFEAMRFTTAHLKELEWKIVVLDEPADVFSLSFFGGKIILSTGLLNLLETDAEIAAFIAYEVGRALARHSSEAMSGLMWMLMLLSFMTYHYKQLIYGLPRYLATGFIYIALLLLIYHLYCIWRVYEADRIGILVSASAGYDPRITLKLYKKFVKNKKRVELVYQPQVIDEALAIYRNALKDKYKDKIVGDNC